MGLADNLSFYSGDSNSLTGLTEAPYSPNTIGPSTPSQYDSLYSPSGPYVETRSTPDKIPSNTPSTVDMPFKEIENPSIGKRLLNNLMGYNDQAFVDRYRAQQASPMIAKLTSEIGKARTAGDLDRADALINTLGQMGIYVPHAVELAKRFSEQNNVIRNNQEQTDAELRGYDLLGIYKYNKEAAFALARYGKEGARTPAGLKQLADAYKLNVSASDSGVVSRSNSLTGELNQEVIAPTIAAEKYSKSKIDAITMLRLNPNTIASLENKINRKQHTPEELDLYNSLIGPINTQAEYNERLERLPAGIGIDKNLAPGRREEITTAPGLRPLTSNTLPTTQTPPNKGGKSPLKPEAFNSTVDVESTVSKIADELESKSGLSKPEAIKKAIELVRQNIPGLGAEQNARLDDIASKGLERYTEAKATETGKGEGRFQSEQSIAAKFTKDGRIITKFNIPQETIDKEGWALFNQPVEQEKIFAAYGSFKEQSRNLKKQIENTPEHALTSDDSSILDKAVAGARRLFAQGVAPIAIAGHSVGVPGMGNVNLNPDEARIYNKLAILMRQAEHVYNIKEKDDPRLGDLRAMLTGKLATKDTMLRAIEDMTESIEDHVRGIIRANNPNAVEESDRKPHMPSTKFIGIANPIEQPSGPQSLTPTPSTSTPNLPPTQQESYGPVTPQPSSLTPVESLLPQIPTTRSTPQVGPTSPLGNSPIINPGRQVSGQATVSSTSPIQGPVPIRANQNLELLRIPIGGKTIQSIKRSFKERSNVK